MSDDHDHSCGLRQSKRGNLPESDEAVEKKMEEWHHRDWMTWLSKNLRFPFTVVRKEDDDNAYVQKGAIRAPFRLGHKFEIIGLEEEIDMSGIRGAAREKSTPEERKNRLTSACTAWNYACVPEKGTAEVLDKYIVEYRKWNPDVDAEECKAIRQDMEKLIAQKQKKYPHVIKQIISCELTVVDGARPYFRRLRPAGSRLTGSRLRARAEAVPVVEWFPCHVTSSADGV